MATLKGLGKIEKSEMLTVKMTKREYAAVKEMANKYAKGSISDWVRYAVKRKPDIKDLLGAEPEE
jgi:hypothetical protein